MIHSFTLRIKCYNLIFSLTAYKIHSIHIYYIRPLDFICHFFYGFGIWMGFFLIVSDFESRELCRGWRTLYRLAVRLRDVYPDPMLVLSNRRLLIFCPISSYPIPTIQPNLHLLTSTPMALRMPNLAKRPRNFASMASTSAQRKWFNCV